MTKILLVEDDESLGSTLVERLCVDGYDVEWRMSLAAGRESFAESSYDLAILDVGLPDGTGFTLGREIKEHSLTPVIFLTAMNSAEYRLEGFELGADDYIPKPFHLKELLLRIRKLISVAQQTHVGDLTFNIGSLSITLSDGRTETLSSRDFDLFKFLAEESPRIISRTEIIAKVFRSDEETSQRVVDNSIVRIRNMLGEAYEQRLRSVRGVGYQWL